MKNNVYTLRILLPDITPEIWRTCKVSGDASFGELHEIIQLVMGWDNLHPFRFLVQDKFIFDDPSAPSFNGKDAIDSDDINIQDILEAGSEFVYEYKRTEWKHIVKVLSVETDKKIRIPECLAGEYPCPPDGTTVAKYAKKVGMIPENELKALANIDIIPINKFLHECHDLGD